MPHSDPGSCKLDRIDHETPRPLSPSFHPVRWRWSQTKAQTKSMRDNPSAYALYHGDGTPSTWADLVTEVLEADVVCFGELHDDAVMHWLQQELVRSLLAQGAHPSLGAEMLEADDQLVVNEYLAGVVNLDKLEAAANLWPNHATDYQPLLDLAKEHGLTMTATNVPRRYASWVYKHGLDGLEDLTPDAQSYLPSLPVAYDPTPVSDTHLRAHET